MGDEYFCAVKLIGDCVQLTVRSSWFKNLNNAKNIRNGFTRAGPYTVFYSPDQNKLPNFNLELKDKYNEEEDACYKVQIYDTFGKYTF